MSPKLIVMLTHHDVTVPDAVEIYEQCRGTKAELWGFKEIGIPEEEMKKLCSMMKEDGKETFFEILTEGEEETVSAVRLALDCGFDYISTKYFESVKALCAENGKKYYPCVGRLEGRPGKLVGSVKEIVDDAKEMMTKGVDGFDLPCFRYTGDIKELTETFMKEISLPVCVAGSVDSYARLDELKAMGCWAFTIGGAFFENKFEGTFAEQIDKVVSYMNP